MAKVLVETIHGSALIDPGEVVGVVRYAATTAKPDQLKWLLRGGGDFYTLDSRANASAILGKDAELLSPVAKPGKGRKVKP